MRSLEAGSVDLVFADPPFNIGYKYDTYKDKLKYSDYLVWSKSWISEVDRVLKPDGTFWLAIGDDFAAELKILTTRELNMTCRSWVIWYYTFGVNCKNKFTRSHTHLFHFVKNPDKFTFNDMEIRVPSARQLVYADKRADSKGRLPDDTWILRPQDIPEAFAEDDSTWYFARVCGTFKERTGWHGCQMPERLLERVIKVSSNPGETVLDPFLGSGGTAKVAKKLAREFIGYEISEEYHKNVVAALKKINAGDPIEGPENPLLSAKKTPEKPHEPAVRRKRIVKRPKKDDQTLF